MKIDSLGTTSNVKRTEKKKKTSSAGSAAFAGLLSDVAESEEVATPPAISESAALTDINPMLSLQEVPDDEVTRKQAMKHGRMSLDILEDLRHQLLMGTIPISTLEKLDGIIQKQRQNCNDPSLEAILYDIEVRAAVELAKLEVARHLSES